MVLLLLCSVSCGIKGGTAVTPCQASDLGAQHGDLGFLPEPHQDTWKHHGQFGLAEMGKTGEGPGGLLLWRSDR